MKKIHSPVLCFDDPGLRWDVQKVNRETSFVLEVTVKIRDDGPEITVM
jgi:hypothetical protein